MHDSPCSGVQAACVCARVHVRAQALCVAHAVCAVHDAASQWHVHARTRSASFAVPSLASSTLPGLMPQCCAQRTRTRSSWVLPAGSSICPNDAGASGAVSRTGVRTTLQLCLARSHAHSPARAGGGRTDPMQCPGRSAARAALAAAAPCQPLHPPARASNRRDVQCHQWPTHTELLWD